jgi:hypothetical protein
MKFNFHKAFLVKLQSEDPTTENFLTTISNCECIDELNEVRKKIDQEIMQTRSNDKGGQNDQEIKQTLSSLLFVRKRIDMQLTHIIKMTMRQHNLQTSPKHARSNSNSQAASNSSV